MPPTADSPAAPAPPAEPGVSGRWVILGILGVALVAAGGSWLFRYNATHRAVEFWGPQPARLIRDAPIVDFCGLGPSELAAAGFAPFESNTGQRIYVINHFDVSNANGITHLRNALLEDRSYVWPARRTGDDPSWKWLLGFRNEKHVERMFILINDDCSEVAMIESPHGKVLSCRPIAAGLREMFAEFAATDVDAPASPAAPAAEAASPNAGVAK